MADPGQDRASPAVDCVIVTFNSGASIQRCLDSLSEEGIRRFVVVDNASRDGCWEIVPQDHVIRNDRNAGFATTVNQEAQELADAEFLLLLNPDAWVYPGSVETLLAALQANRRAAATGPTILDEHGHRTVPAPRFSNAWKDIVETHRLTRVFPAAGRQQLFQGSLLPRQGPSWVDWVSGACMPLRRTVWDGLRGFSKEFFLYGEKLDWCWRAAKAHSERPEDNTLRKFPLVTMEGNNGAANANKPSISDSRGTCVYFLDSGGLERIPARHQSVEGLRHMRTGAIFAREMARRCRLEGVGPYDPRWPIREEVDLSVQLLPAGSRVASMPLPAHAHPGNNTRNAYPGDRGTRPLDREHRGGSSR